MANVGDQKNEVLTVNKDLFKTELKRLMACYEELDASIFFRLVHAAYDKALNDLKIIRYCCRRHYLSHVDLVDII